MKNILIIIGLMVFSISCSDDEVVVVKCSAESDSATVAGALLTAFIETLQASWAALPDNALTECTSVDSACYDDLLAFILEFNAALTQAASSCASAEAYLDCWTAEGITADDAGNDRAHYISYFNTMLTYNLSEDFTADEIGEIGGLLSTDPEATLDCADFGITID